MTSSEVPNIMMIGPTESGKTTLLKVLRLAAARKLSDGTEVSVAPENPYAKQIFGEALSISKTGVFGRTGTLAPTECTFTISCEVEKDALVNNWVDKAKPGIRAWIEGTVEKVNEPRTERIKEESVMRLTVLDGAGGDILGRAHDDKMEDQGAVKDSRSRLIELAAKSVALIVCVNASDSKSTEAFFRDFQEFFDDVKEYGGQVPFQRVAIVVTQADRLVEDFGSTALSELEQRDASAEASKAMGFFALSGLFQALSPEARERVYAGWASVYGFIPMEGSVNFDSEQNRMAIFKEDDARWTENWFPYGVVAPFVFACTGKTSNLVKVTKP